MKDFNGRLIRLSANVQFLSGKASLLFSTVTMATVLSMKFHWPWLAVFGGVVALGILGVVFVVWSGWYREEMKYTGRRLDLK